MVMSFENQIVLNYLLQEGIVYTFRIHKRKRYGSDWITDKRGGSKIADANIFFVKDVRSSEDLEPYVHHSGFRDLSEWTTAIEELTGLRLEFEKKGEIKGYLFRVSLRRV